VWLQIIKHWIPDFLYIYIYIFNNFFDLLIGCIAVNETPCKSTPVIFLAKFYWFYITVPEKKYNFNNVNNNNKF